MADILEGAEADEYFSGDLDEKEVLGEDEDNGV